MRASLRTCEVREASVRRAIATERARLRFKLLRREGLTSRYRVREQRGRRFAAPVDMRLIRNTHAVLVVLASCRSCLERGYHVVLELEGVACFDLAAALLLTAFLNQKWPQEARLTTTLPKKHGVMAFLADSGVLGHVGWVTTNGRPPARIAARMSKSSGLVEKEGRIEVAATRADEVSGYVVQTFEDNPVRGSRGWQQGRSVYKILIELMNNTAQHAGTPGTQRWWVAARRTGRGAIEVAFLDLGAGVVRTLRRRVAENVKEKAGLGTDDAALLEDLMSGKLQHILTRSATGLPSRGNGFQEMRRAVSDRAFASLTILANGALCRLLSSGMQTDRLTAALPGTLVHFEVQP